MKALYLADSSGTTALVKGEVPTPQAASGELLIRVIAAGVTPTELLWYPTSHTKSGEARSSAIPGHEFSGVIAALGTDVTGLEIGQDVYGMNDWFSDGAMAEYCVSLPACVAPKPTDLTHAEAASVPIGALTAWQGLYDRAQLQAGERVLVHGGSGAVGVYAVQLARLRGATVIATASARNLDVVSGLGAQQVIDYRAARFEDIVRDIDVVFDTVGGETLERSWSILKPQGRMISIAADVEGTTEERVKRAFFIVEPKREQLVKVGDLLQAGVLRPVVDAVVPFAQASAAFTGQVADRQGRGRMVIVVPA